MLCRANVSDPRDEASLLSLSCLFLFIFHFFFPPFFFFLPFFHMMIFRQIDMFLFRYTFIGTHWHKGRGEKNLVRMRSRDECLAKNREQILRNVHVDVPRGDQFSVENPWPYSRFSTLHPRLLASSPPPSRPRDIIVLYAFRCPAVTRKSGLYNIRYRVLSGIPGTYRDLAIRRTLSSQRKLEELRDSHSYNEFPGSIVK